MQPKNEPKNHHYVPQHFLRAWEAAKGKVLRYRRISATGKVEVRESSIRKTASADDLYRVWFRDGSLQVESSIVTRWIDEDGHRILERARNESVVNWGVEERKRLATYLTCLEARNPAVLREMDLTDRLDEIRLRMIADGCGSHKSVDEVVDYLKATKSLGVAVLALFAQNEKLGLLGNPFAHGLLDAYWEEINFEGSPLLTSTYPTARWGDYLKAVFFVIALSPSKALIISRDPNVRVLRTIPEPLRHRVINFYTLAKANEAFHHDASLKDFVSSHMGWAKGISEIDKQRETLGEFICREMSGRQAVR